MVHLWRTRIHVFAILIFTIAWSTTAEPQNRTSGSVSRREFTGVKNSCSNGGYALTFHANTPWELNQLYYIQATLTDFGIRGTFFLKGFFSDPGYPQGFQCIYDPYHRAMISFFSSNGHEVGWRGWSAQDYAGDADVFHVTDRIAWRMDEAISSILGVRPRLVQPVDGDIEPASFERLEIDHDKVIVGYKKTFDTTEDWMAEAAKGPHSLLANIAVSSTFDYHEIQNGIRKMYNSGYTFSTVSECLGEEPYSFVGLQPEVYIYPDTPLLYTPRDECTGSTSTWEPSCLWGQEVGPGETCQDVAYEYGATFSEIKALNPIIDCSRPLETSTEFCLITPIPTGDRPCTRMHMSVAGDTCASIGAEYGMRRYTLTRANPIITNCDTIPADLSLCVTTERNPPTCISTRVSLGGDTCQSLADQHRIPFKDLKEANWRFECRDLVAGMDVCYPPRCVRRDVIAEQETVEAFALQRGMTEQELRQANWRTFLYPGGPPVCLTTYFDPAICVRTSISVAGDACDEIAAAHGMEPVLFRSMNQALDCYSPLDADLPLCLSTYFDPRTCLRTSTTKDGDTCEAISIRHGMEQDVFHVLNPALICEGPVEAEMPLCLSTYFDPAACVRTIHTVQGDRCSVLATTHGMPIEEFEVVNPVPDCESTLPTGTPICLTTPYFDPAGCVRTSASIAGDTCDSLAYEHGMDRTDFDTTNPFLPCDGVLSPSTPICLTTHYDPPCAKPSTSAVGDTCGALSAQYGMELRAFKAKNPVLDCDAAEISVTIPVCLSEVAIPDPPNPPDQCAVEYTSRRGDTCHRIEARFGLEEGTVLEFNTFLACHDIWPQTTICIPQTAGICSDTWATPWRTTCAAVGGRFGVNEAVVKYWNDFVDCSNIGYGIDLCVSQ